jgi:sugar O-acyltransferase (sialic acid O-acetyltransferase NeuD family)
MKDLIILGTGVHGLETREIVERVNRAKKRWRLLGYIAAEAKDVGADRNGLKVIGSKENIGEYPEAEFVPDNEWPRSIEVPMERLVSLVDPSAFVCSTAEIGRGCVIYPHSYVGHKAKIGDYVFALAGTIINHDDVVEDRVVFASAAVLAGHVHVEADCYMGQSSTVRQYLRIGKGSLVGMGAVVVKDVPPNSVMAGNPARRLRDKA